MMGFHRLIFVLVFSTFIFGEADCYIGNQRDNSGRMRWVLPKQYKHCNKILPGGIKNGVFNNSNVWILDEPFFTHDSNEAAKYMQDLESTLPIIYKRVTTYQWIYNDGGTGSYSDVSIWRPYTLEPDSYFAIGDVAVATHNAPQTSALLVKDNTDNAVVPPSNFTEIWNDMGSGGSHNVRIMKMSPPSGYVCLGHVAILGYGSTPDRNLYRCVKRQYVSRGVYQIIWKDSGSGAHSDVSIYGNRMSQLNLKGLDTNTFTSFSTYLAPGAPFVLDYRFAQNNQDADVYG